MTPIPASSASWRPTAIAAGKEIRKLETIEEQLLAFADLPEKAQLRFLMDGVREMDEESAMLAEMVNAWAAGDAARLEQILIEEDFREMPEIYQALLVRRNANWAKRDRPDHEGRIRHVLHRRRGGPSHRR